MNLVFMGTPEFAVPSLRRLVADGHRIAAVVTASDKPRGRGQKFKATPVEEAATGLGLRVLKPADLTAPDFRSELIACAPDALVVVAFRILPESIFGIPPRGTFNLHASLLPRYRGAAPIAWAILNGERETGVTTFLLQKKVDTGEILLQERVTIGPDETAGELHDRLSAVGAELVSRTVEMLGSGAAKGRRQDDAEATPARKITQDDCRIDWSKPALEVHNRVRAFSPTPGAWTLLAGKVLKVFRTVRSDEAPPGGTVPGVVVRCSADECAVSTGSGVLLLSEVMLEGRKRLRIGEFLRGHRVEVGTILGR